MVEACTTGHEHSEAAYIISEAMEFYLSTSDTTQTGGAWVDVMPELEEGYYLWTRWKTTWASDCIYETTTKPVLGVIIDSACELYELEALELEAQQKLRNVAEQLWYYALSLRAHIEQYAPDKDAGYLAMIDASINETRVQMNKLGIEVDV